MTIKRAVKKKRIRKALLPLPEGVEIGGLVRYYRRGWRVGTLREVKGNKAAIIPSGYNCNGEKRGKWVAFSDITKIDNI